jgi:hypothetical protein
MMILRMIRMAVAILLTAIQTSNGAGVAVTKEQPFHADKSAKPFVFNEAADFGRHVRFVTGRRTFTIERTTYLDYVNVLSAFPANITTAAEIAPIRESVKNISAFSAKYPAAEPLLRQHLEALKKVLNAFSSGWVLYEKSWMRAEEFAPIRERLAQLEKEATEKKAKEALERKEELNKAETTVIAEMERNSIQDAQYTIREPIGAGSFIELAERTYSPELLYLEDAPIGPQKGGGTLYYSGSYQLQSQYDGVRIIRTYHQSRATALAHLRDHYYATPTYRKSISVPSSASNRIQRSYEPGFRAPDGLVWVNGYFREDGTWIQGHYRSAPNSSTLASGGYKPGIKSNFGGSTYSGKSRSNGYGRIPVRGYYRKNGTYVRPHTRRR